MIRPSKGGILRDSWPKTALTAALTAFAGATVASAQEMEPRAYSASPVGANFVAIAIGTSRGEILFDPTVPITDAEGAFNSGTVGYGRTFAIGNRQALVTFGVPYVWGRAEGLVGETSTHIRRAGFGDLRAKFSVNLVGPKAMTPAEFAAAPRRTVVGVSLAMAAPTGEYDETKLINLGTNRFALKPEIGVSVPVGRWFLDAHAGAWFFASNDNFYPGHAVRRQDPLFSAQAHGSYTFKSRAWIAIDATWYGGGESTTDGGPPSTRQNNTRFGATASIPVWKNQSLKLSGSTGASARTGDNFTTVLAGWQIVWFDRVSSAARRSASP